MKKYSDMISGIVIMALAMLMFILSLQINMKESDAIGAAFLPFIVVVIVFAFSAVLAVRGFFSSKTYVAAKEDYPTNTSGVLIMIIACLLYAVLLKPVGFILDSVAFLFLSMCLMTKKEQTNYIKFAIITVVSVVAIYMVFTQAFGIRLPHGIL